MAFDVLLPKLGFSMESAELTEWLVPDGALVEAGQPLFAIESDKSVNEIEAPVSGRLAVLAQPGETYPVGTVLATITEENA